ncbi:hypothetical protein [Roseibium salinum]|uniref:Uncharacterized protein n=1 Tax=Roseibium salinum TaxID=1604349 RepID=A0ABT3R7S2_9HYPH|nr:hypothetical protein [Roseibium sp. DSM 29163]MCX2725092.1 hypothetical protein [Roseibium sp. DSM 29163]
MKNEFLKRFALLSLSLAVFTGVSGQTAWAASYKNLASKGYKISKLTRSPSGSMGWYLTGEGKKYFCLLNVGVVYIGETGMGIFTSSGRLIEVDRATYHKHQGVSKTDAPQMSDLKAGRVRPRDVGVCTFAG